MTNIPTERPLTRTKKLLFTVMMLSLPGVVLVTTVVGYYTYRKLEDNVVVTEPFGKLDDELGWVLKPRVDARVYHQNRWTGAYYYDTRVRTNGDGFRARSTDEQTAVETAAAIGDSWTFGTAVNNEETYPSQLAERLGVPVVNLGIPAYGLAQVILLLERQVERLKPKAVLHVNKGLWARSVCRGEAPPQQILKPCFWRGPTGAYQLVTPSPGHVQEMAARGIYPGGWLTAGYNTWTYYLISRPVVRFMQLLARFGLISGQIAEDDLNPPQRAAMLGYALERLLRLAERHDFVFILYDPDGDYAEAASSLSVRYGKWFAYMGPAVAKAEVLPLVAKIPRERQTVPRDGHFTGEYMAAWAAVFAPRVAAALARR
ncbi:MAG: hypothetical protein WD073_09890 [Xanthobacteraceae bacterium]